MRKSPKQHGNTGRQNALKGSVPASVNINIRIDPSLREAAKQRAADQGMTFSAWIIRLIRRELRAESQTAAIK